jgi:Na+-transporting NADH:ubiquinone oxidoreductase subunit F
MMKQILITVVVLGGINGLLALLLVIAERFIANYGQCRITINDEKSFEIQGGSSLLNSLKTQKIFLPSACGGRGTCAYCKCRVVENGGTVLPTEVPLLTKDEIKKNIRLACQLKVKKDLAVEIPEELFNIQEFKAVVGRLEDLTSDIKFVRLELKQPETIQFKPGQYIQLQNNVVHNGFVWVIMIHRLNIPIAVA